MIQWPVFGMEASKRKNTVTNVERGRRSGGRPRKVLVHCICNLRYCCDSKASLKVYIDLCVSQMGLVPSHKGFAKSRKLLWHLQTLDKE